MPSFSFIYRRCCYCPFVRGADNVHSMRCIKHYVSGRIVPESYVINISSCYYCPDAEKNILLDPNQQFTLYE